MRYKRNETEFGMYYFRKKKKTHTKKSQIWVSMTSVYIIYVHTQSQMLPTEHLLHSINIITNPGICSTRGIFNTLWRWSTDNNQHVVEKDDSYRSLLYDTVQHDYSTTPLFPHHLPEMPTCVRQRTLKRKREWKSEREKEITFYTYLKLRDTLNLVYS